MTQDPAGGHLRRVALQDVQVSATDRRGVDVHDDVSVFVELAAGDPLPAHVSRPVVNERLHVTFSRLHGVSPPGFAPAPAGRNLDVTRADSMISGAVEPFGKPVRAHHPMTSGRRGGLAEAAAMSDPGDLAGPVRHAEPADPGVPSGPGMALDDERRAWRPSNTTASAAKTSVPLACGNTAVAVAVTGKAAHRPLNR
jgi:hypothetical protein